MLIFIYFNCSSKNLILNGFLKVKFNAKLNYNLKIMHSLNISSFFTGTRLYFNLEI